MSPGDLDRSLSAAEQTQVHLRAALEQREEEAAEESL